MTAHMLQPVTKRPYNAETPLPVLRKDRTPTELFYVRNHFDVPSIDINEFQLHVNGAVANPLELTLSQLRASPKNSLLVVMECAGNGRASMKPAIKGTPWDIGAISQAEFTGTPLYTLLREADISDNVTEVRFTGADRGEIRTGGIESYARSLPLDVALHPDTLLVWEMNGEPLSQQHGYPLRLVVPGWYGMASVKWLREITLLTQPFEGFFQTPEYVYIGEEGTRDETPVSNMRVRSLILEPEVDGFYEQDEIQVAGIAWTGEGKVTKVELSFDDGEQWVEADITPSRSSYGASRWEYVWRPASSGKFTITVRAQDSNGNLQPLHSLWNKGGYGNNYSHQTNVSVNLT
jgi:DMSO/TMAO reductase YedYZ molybdopterin-dependent catalytic subunit